ncbi:hypothetical protein [Nocardia pneumoniae]|uniref:hypothetical protein n=1 Tax=Nocardia pneumoniae TaxID=228601 RepID=UPI00030C9182|nr:hypothetical protein [Nocardia pneumoniae]
MVDAANGDLYIDLVMAVLPKAARHFLESLMPTTGTHKYRSEFARHYYSEGKAEGEVLGEAKALLRVLRSRGITVPEPTETRVRECTDQIQIETWLDRALTARDLDEVFSD